MGRQEKVNTLVSVIIRTKNEERWISQCLKEVFAQRYKDFEVIIVDNRSNDRTIEKAKQFNIKKIVTCDEYFPGKALNIGIGEAKGDFIACLSGHCIPINDEWLSNLVKDFESDAIAGVYGRQEPMNFTPNSDKRDLALVFGLDKKVQIKESFFHNANSMIRKSVWDCVPFDDNITNIEDRVWAQKVLQMGYKIIYEPEASVYHYHGIHQNGDMERCTNVVRILQELHGDYANKSIDAGKLNTVALIPVRGPVQYIEDKPLLAYTIERALESKYIKEVIVSTDNPELVQLSKKLGAKTPFLRDPSLSREQVDLAKVLQYSLNQMEELKIFPDLIVSLEITFPFRPKGLLDDMILQLTKNGFDSVVAAKRENRAIWKEEGGSIIQVEEGLTPRQFKDPTFIELRGVACVMHSEFLRQGKLLGQKIGIYEINNSYSHLEVRTERDLKMASHLIKDLF